MEGKIINVFVPYAQPYKTAKCLDNKRLNKQILECIQLLSANTGIDVGWKIPKYIYNHPNTLLWNNDCPYLVLYCLLLLEEYKMRKNKIHKCLDILNNYFYDYAISSNYLYESNLKHLTPELCKQHQQILLQKNYEHYSKYFGG